MVEPVDNIDRPPTWDEKVEKLGAAGVTFAIFLLFATGMFMSAIWDMSANQTFTNQVETLKSLLMLAAGFWIGASKIGQDAAGTMSNIVRRTSTAPSTELISALDKNTAATVQSAVASTANTTATAANTTATNKT